MSSSVDSSSYTTSNRNGLVPKLNYKISIPNMEGTKASSQDSISGVLRPLFVSLKMAGLCFETQYQRLVSISLIYCYVVLVLSWIHTLGLFFAYNSSKLTKWEILLKVAFHTLFLNCALTVTLFLTKVNRQFPRVLRKWEVYRAKYKGVSLQVIAKYTLKCIAVLWVVYALMAASGLLLMSTKYLDIVIIILKPFVTQQTSMLIIIPCRIFHYFFLLPYTFSAGFVYLLCRLLKMEFVEILLQSSAPRRSHVEAGDPAREFDRLRRRHTAMAEILNILEEAISGYIFIAFVLNLAFVAFYILLLMMGDEVYEGGFAPFVAHWFTLSVPGAHLLVIAWAGLTISGQVQVTKGFLTSVLDLESLGPSKQLTVQIFINKLQHDHFGITVGGLVNLGKNVFFFVVCVIVLYTVILVRCVLPENVPEWSQSTGSENGVTMMAGLINQTAGQVP